MAELGKRRELGRGERVMRGLYRLRLPLPWPGVPHCNAWAIACGGEFVLVDTGYHDEHSQADLERALEMCGLHLADAALVVCTHAHADHCGQAMTVSQIAGCEVWMHPSHAQLDRLQADPDAFFQRRLEVARQSGVPDEALRRYAAERRPSKTGIDGTVVIDRDLLEGIRIGTDLGEWVVYETPGHAPSHVCLFQPERRLLISGDHLLGRVSQYFDYGYSPDPVGEFLTSLDRVEELGARLCLAGHGRTFTDVQAHIEANRKLAAERQQAILDVLGAEPLTAFEIVPRAFGEWGSAANASWLLPETLAHLTHLDRSGRARRLAGEPERWAA